MTGAMTVLLAAAAKKTSGSPSILIFLVLIAVVGYFLLIRPQKQKQRRQREQQSSVAVGDEVVTVGGIVGRVVGVDADRITIVSGENTVGFPAAGNEPHRMVLVKNAIARKLEPTVTTNTADDESDDTATGAAANGSGDYGADGASSDDEHDSRPAGAPLPSAESEGTGS